MTNDQLKELLIDAIENNRPTIQVDDKEMSQLELLISIEKQSIANNNTKAFSQEELEKLATLIGGSMELKSSQVIRLSFVDDQIGQLMLSEATKNGVQFDNSDGKLQAALAGLISRGNLTTANQLLKETQAQGVSIVEPNTQFNLAFSRCAATIEGRSTTKASEELQKNLVNLMQELPWDVNAKINGRTLPQYFQSADLAVCYDHTTRVMADAIKEQAQLNSEQAERDAGSSINLRGSL